MSATLRVTAAAICAAVALSEGVLLEVTSAQQAAAVRFVPGELLIQYDSAATDTDRAAVRGRLRATRRRSPRKKTTVDGDRRTGYPG